jgi:hypothetical protein
LEDWDARVANERDGFLVVLHNAFVLTGIHVGANAGWQIEDELKAPQHYARMCSEIGPT